MENTKLRIVLVDDHPIYREGVARTLADVEGMDIVGQAADGERAVAMVRDLRPDLVLLDISMPHGGGIPALATIMQEPKPPLVVMLTASENEDDLMQALRFGAQGYVLKGVGAAELVTILRDVAAGRTHVAPGLAGRILANMRAGKDGASAAPANPLADLSKREEDILRLVSRGMSNREVGLKLDLQEKTVKHYMTSILQKLHLRNRVEAAMLAREHLKG
jgi:two-component system nitrate/nitrite response regulator NarL